MLELAAWLLGRLVALPGAVWTYICDWLHFWRLANRFPSPRALPIIGNLFECAIRPQVIPIFNYLMLDVMHHCRTGRFRLGPVNLFYINEPEDVQCYLHNPSNQIKPPFIYKIFAEGIGKGLVTENGERWQRHHKILASTFHLDLLNSYVPTFNRKCDIFIDLLNKHSDGRAFDMKPMIEHLTVDVILESMMGVPSNQQIHPDHKIFRGIESGQAALSYRIVRPWLYPWTLFELTAAGKKGICFIETMQALGQRVIRERLQLLQEGTGIHTDDKQNGKKKRYGPLDALLLEKQKGAPISDTDIVDEVITTILAGYDTTYLTVLMVLYSLAKNPNIQEKVLGELEKTFGVTGRIEVTPDSLQRVPYLDMVIKETLRMYPPAWIIARRTGVDTPLQSCDLTIPAGALVVICPKSLHMDPKLYPNPEVFNPERFSPENCASRHNFAFLPFSAGQRICIGKRFALMEITTILCKVLWNYEVRPDPTYEPHYIWAITSAPENGMWIKITKRR